MAENDDNTAPDALDLALEDLLEALDGIVYAVDREGRIVAHSTGDWSAACEAGGAPELAEPETVLGRPLADFAAGDEVRGVIERQLAAVLAGEGPVVYHFRCDAPDVRREMRMAISPLRSGGAVHGALFQSVVLREAVRPPLDIYDHKALRERFADRNSIPVVTMCAYCQRLRRSPDEPFVDAEAYYRAGGTSEVRVSHGICPDCITKVEPAGLGSADGVIA